MNYRKLYSAIVLITSIALLLCVVSFWVVLTFWSGSDYDFQGASGVATILPSFAGVIIAAIALHSYIKAEDPAYRESQSIFSRRKKLLSHIEAMIIMDQKFINAMSLNPTQLEFYLGGLTLVMQKNLQSVLDLSGDLLHYFEQSLSKTDVEKFCDLFADLTVLQMLVKNKTGQIEETITLSYTVHERLINLVAITNKDLEHCKSPDAIYGVLEKITYSDYLTSRGQMIAANHAEILKKMSEPSNAEVRRS